MYCKHLQNGGKCPLNNVQNLSTGVRIIEAFNKLHANEEPRRYAVNNGECPFIAVDKCEKCPYYDVR